MSDIIKDAKQLLDSATPGPWTAEIESFTENEGGDFSLQAAILAEGEPLMGADDGMVYHKEGNFGLAAAAPELAQALAEETYEYGVAYIGANHGGHHIEWVESTGDAELDKDTLHRLVARWERKGQSPKIVRRRVSPPEVINEQCCV